MTSTDSPPQATGTKRARARVGPLLAVGGVLAVLVAAALFALVSDRYLAGVPNPGAFTAYGMITLRVVAEISAVLVIGSLLFAAFMAPPQQSGVLAPDGYAAVRMAGWASVIWCVSALLSIPFTTADTFGRPVSQLFDIQTLVDLAGAAELTNTWLVTAAIAFLVAVGTRLVLTWGWATVLFFVSVGGLLPLGVSGHSSSGGQHDLATNSLLLHLIAAALWVGGLVALLAHGRRKGEHLGLAASRFSKVALACWIVMAASGVINALVRLPVADLFSTNYGLLVVAKIVALLALGVFGYFQRERGVATAVATGSGRALVKLAAFEVLVMMMTIGIAAALARTPPPQQAVTQPNNVELRIGYTLDGAPTFLKALVDWRFDLIYGTAAIALAVLYLLGVRRLKARGDAWPVGRTVAWLCGCATILLATSSGIGRYSPSMFSIHMISHMMLNMLAPILLVLGGAVTLALRALPTAGKDNPPGPREWLVALVHSPLARLLTHPVVALVLFVGSYYMLYFSGLFDSALDLHWAHLAMNAHFVITGYIFYWPVIGIDPAPRRLPPVGRLAMVFASLPFHAFFGVILMSMQQIIGDRFYRSLALPWASDLLSDQRLGGGIAWAAGELPLIVVLVALLVQWARQDEKEARRRDRKADADGEAELAAYNAMLDKMNGGKRG
ncbi:bifunctional copper resistance protein CopD/cytochrome c oxidase assembly protein [Kibdelosporangium philippinense]|uniref:Bifunctional copper resistance protein CopD/cytochrome c oxidase assembly protein n=1 Tax=Kibdelosporangium philippinense TaxID=211113 RepID=A0ABS8ZI57_9PSEU|nr:cytochrome c oxidase assembly protein [Kibdelosporangium philippinense]MCE7007486.1 bifunctional copper resistance protein CopD/cytochrome c oxidase assembly protein [Kibdelosporangium philippinense]